MSPFDFRRQELEISCGWSKIFNMSVLCQTPALELSGNLKSHPGCCYGIWETCSIVLEEIGTVSLAFPRLSLLSTGSYNSYIRYLFVYMKQKSSAWLESVCFYYIVIGLENFMSSLCISHSNATIAFVAPHIC